MDFLIKTIYSPKHLQSKLINYNDLDTASEQLLINCNMAWPTSCTPLIQIQKQRTKLKLGAVYIKAHVVSKNTSASGAGPSVYRKLKLRFKKIKVDWRIR